MNHVNPRLAQLTAAVEAGSSVWTVHYACENFNLLKDRPAEISCVAFAEVTTGEVRAFAQADIGEPSEEFVLQAFFKHLQETQQSLIVHWNMNNADFGFQAMESRWRFTQKTSVAPYAVPRTRLVDLDDLVGEIYGKGYADHPRLTSIAALNEYQSPNMLSGKDEAERLSTKSFNEIRRSVSEKAKLIAFILKRVIAGTLETKNGGRRVPFAGTNVDNVRLLVAVGEKFLDVSRELTRRHDKRDTLTVNDEYDAQDLYRSLLKVFFEDVRAEEWTPSYGGGAKRIDFVLPEYRTAVELKHTRPSMKSATVGDELKIDIEQYKVHKDVRHLVCIVFDRDGHLANPRGLERDLSGLRDRLAVTVRVLDR